jgi:hypothetical protein
VIVCPDAIAAKNFALSAGETCRLVPIGFYSTT